MSRAQLVARYKTYLQSHLDKNAVVLPGRFVKVHVPLSIWLPEEIEISDSLSDRPDVPALPLAPHEPVLACVAEVPVTAIAIDSDEPAPVSTKRKRSRPPVISTSTTSDGPDDETPRPAKRARTEVSEPPLGNVVVLSVREHRGALDNLEFLTDYSDGDTIWVPLGHHVYEENDEIWCSAGLRAYIETTPSGKLIRKSVERHIARAEKLLEQRLTRPCRRLKAHEYYKVISIGSSDAEDDGDAKDA
jgi:hypothetical protein